MKNSQWIIYSETLPSFSILFYSNIFFIRKSSSLWAVIAGEYLCNCWTVLLRKKCSRSPSLILETRPIFTDFQENRIIWDLFGRAPEDSFHWRQKMGVYLFPLTNILLCLKAWSISYSLQHLCFVSLCYPVFEFCWLASIARRSHQDTIGWIIIVWKHTVLVAMPAFALCKGAVLCFCDCSC